MGENDLVSREAAIDVSDTNVGDMISRRAVMDALLELYEYQRYVDPSWAADLVRQGIFMAEKKIEELPSAEPKKGKWTVKDGELAFWDVCSVCGKKIIHRVPHYKFCPNCGAKMEGKDGDGNG